MIKFQSPYFVLETEKLSYIFSVMPTHQLEHLYFGRKIIDQTYEALHTKLDAGMGSTIEYVSDYGRTYLDLMPLEYSGIGKGDFRLSPLEIKYPDGTYVNDFVYESHEIHQGIFKSDILPFAQAQDEDAMHVRIIMKDHYAKLELILIYTVFEKTNTLTRKVILKNHHQADISIRKIMSMMLDLPETDYDLLTFDGGWIKEAHLNKRSLNYGIYINDSKTGASSNRHNPGMMLAKKNTTQDDGVCIGINLIYSGNHYEAVEMSQHGSLRIMNGINPYLFEWPLKEGESFETPEAVLTYSETGFNTLSHHFHDFVNNHIIPKPFQKKARPVVLNSWEAFYFDFNHKKLVHLAKQAKKLGVELFVLDDGWFGQRDNDQTSLGDYDINKKKLPKGLSHLCQKMKGLGLDFGLWFEPEMINPKSKLYEAHPDYAISIPGRTPALGRHQLVLDLCNPEVRQYIKRKLKQVISSAEISYIKWDMNRHITDMYSRHIREQGMFFHAYMLGLYEILNDIKASFPNMLIETCSSGGNRFDLGMLTYGAQIWSSDNTDPIERLSIQEGLSYLYPLSTISAHVSMAPHAQTLRTTPLSTRFNVASFGVLGYELDLSYMKPVEKKEIKKQIELYKKHRDLFQFGTFFRFDSKTDNQKIWQVSLGPTHILGNYQVLQKPSPKLDTLTFKHVVDDAIYQVTSINQGLAIDRFGHLISHALPIKLHPDGWIMRQVKKRKMLDNATEMYQVSGTVLRSGFKLKQQFSGTYYNKETRILGDFGSQLYIAEKMI